MPSQDFVLYTLFDITKTNIIKNCTSDFKTFVDDADQIIRNKSEWDLSRNQQRNYEIIIQLIGFRAQPIIRSNPTKILNSEIFKDSFGPQTVWKLNFSSEFEDVYSTDLFIDEFDNIPLIPNLTETAKFEKPILKTHGHNKNITFSI
jgi:hypothetical protein